MDFYFQFLAIVNNADTYIRIQVSVWLCALFPLGKCLGVEWLGGMVGMDLTF